MIALATITPEQFDKICSDLSDFAAKLDICDSIIEMINSITQYIADPYSDDESLRLHARTLCSKQKDLNNFAILLSELIAPISESLFTIADALGLASIDLPNLDPYSESTPGKKKIPVCSINIDKIYDKRRTHTEDTPQAPTLPTNPPTVSDYPWMDPYPTTPNPAA